MNRTPTIAGTDLAAITRFLGDPSPAGSARTFGGWAEARRVDAMAVRGYGHLMALNTLELIQRRVGEEGEPELEVVPDAIAAAVMCGFQLGVDAERRRRDATELPR